MPHHVRAAALAVFMVACCGAANAQGFDETCQRMLNGLCGNDSLERCFSREATWNYVPDICVGDVQTMIEMEREARADRSSGTGLLGYSYGGVLRRGPGTEYGRVASLHDGQRIEILEDTGVWFDGYKWFRVGTDAGEGYHWGGIFCTEGGAPIEGVFEGCN